MNAVHSFRLRCRRTVMVLVLMVVSRVLASCNTTEPRRDETSPMAPQWQTLRRVAR